MKKMQNSKEQEQQLIIMGKNPVMEALSSERSINKIYLAEGMQKGSSQKIVALAKEKKVIVQFVPKSKIDQMAGSSNHQGVVASISAYDYYDIHELLQKIEQKETAPFLLILDELEDPHNLGSIMRTADVTGVDGIIIPKRRSVGLTSTVAKTSAGAIEYVPVARVTNLAQTIDLLKEKGYWIVGTDASGKQFYHQVDYQIPIAIVIGSEGKGMGKLIKDKCDFVVKLPMKGHVNSLNASVAASLLMYEVYRHRGF